MNVPNVGGGMQSCSVFQNKGNSFLHSQVGGGASGLEERAFTPIKLEVLSWYLDFYPDREAAQLLLSGFQFGFRLGYQGPKQRRCVEI